jgi:undecaprenyl-diphosphatase
MWPVVLLAIVQGLTEFFPVSSSGHLVLFEAFLGIRGEGSGSSVLFEVAVHIGTLGAVVCFYRRKLARLIHAILSLIFRGGAGWARNRGEMRYLGYIAIGTVPAATVGLLLQERIGALFNAPAVVSLLLVATAAYLLLGRLRVAPRELSWRTALLIGVSQAVAILPGISRSGWTITTGLLLGVGFSEAAEYSFLLSIPAIIGALALELAGDATALGAGSSPELLVGAIVAFLSGWLALKLLLGVLTRGAFHRFAFYLLPVGAAAFFYFVLSSPR